MHAGFRGSNFRVLLISSFTIVLGGIASERVSAGAPAWFRAILGDTCGQILCGTGRVPSVAGYLNTTFR
ncbi:MAG: hypothetical protein Q4B51_08225, partial [Coriobacteriaceae bacterium]|nr:hypothetical protein [Coriobacteriaceae bacterium]